MTQSPKIIITGATSGLGREMALQLAARGESIIACGRRAERLAELEQVSNISGQQLDLSSAENISAFCDNVSTLDGVILNAGITFADKFVNGDSETDSSLIQTNVSANVQLIRGLLPALKANKGRILIIASLGGLTPIPYQSVYAGTKAFMINFGLSLREELKHEDVSVSIFAPGGIKTEMTNIPAMKALEHNLAPVAEVARDAIKAYDKRSALTVPGTQNKIIALASKLGPREIFASKAERIYRKALAALNEG